MKHTFFRLKIWWCLSIYHLWGINFKFNWLFFLLIDNLLFIFFQHKFFLRFSEGISHWILSNNWLDIWINLYLGLVDFVMEGFFWFHDFRNGAAGSSSGVVKLFLGFSLGFFEGKSVFGILFYESCIFWIDSWRL